MGKGGLCGGYYLSVAGLWLAVADVVQRAGRKNHRVLRHCADVAAQRVQRQRADVDAVDADAPLRAGRCVGGAVHVIKALQQLKYRSFAGTAGPDQRHGFARRQRQRKILQRRRIWARRIVKIHPFKGDGQTATRHRQGGGLRRRRHRRFAGQQLHQALGGTGGAQQVAIDLAQHRHGAGQQRHINHGLAQVAGAHLTGQHRLGAPKQPPQQQARVGDDDEGHQRRARAGAAHGSGKSAFGGLGKTRHFLRLGGVALHDGDGVQNFSGDGAGVGHAVLAGAREAAHAPANPHAGQHHDYQHQ